MKTLRTTFSVCCFLLLPHVPHAAPSVGHVIGWGNNAGGQATGFPSVSFSNGTFSLSDNPFATGCVRIASQSLSNAVAVSAGFGHSLALRSDGTVVGWGGNGLGAALGYETPYPGRTNGVVSINGQILSNVVSVVAAREFSLALKKDGTVITWGQKPQKAKGTSSFSLLNANEQTNVLFRKIEQPIVDPYTGRLVSTNVILIPAYPEWQMDMIKNSRDIEFKPDGTVTTSMKNGGAIILSNVISIAAGGACSLVAKSDGTVLEWGNMPEMQPGVPSGLSNVVAVAVGESYQGARNIALLRDGTVTHWGEETVYKDATPPVGLSNVVAVAAGANHSVALKSDGTVIGWGFNNFGQATGIPNTNSPGVSAGQVRVSGQVLSNVASISAGRGYSMALKKDGTIITWGRMVNDLYPVTVPEGLSNVVAIAAGDNFCLVITTNSAIADRYRQK
ncbi:MAG: hypothetical protein ABSA45_01380 [Verrucomicrobiota bacterium]